MNVDIDYLQSLIANNKTNVVLERLSALLKEDDNMHNQVLTLLARYNDVGKRENLGLLSSGEAGSIRNQVNYAVLELIGEMNTANAIKPGSKEGKEHSHKGVFISYNHNDIETANKLKNRLQASSIKVIIDNESLQAGEDIQDFIEKSVRDTDVTISIISKKSLLSAWVAMETINTYYHEKTRIEKKFIPVYIEDDFFDRSFTDSALDYIDKELQTVEELRISRMQKGRNTRDLNNEYTRLKDLSHNMDEIVRRLRESLCIDIRGENLDRNFDKILKRIDGERI